MTPSDHKTRNDVIEFATILYGAAWREQLAQSLGTTRRNLDHWMSAPNPLPASIVLGVVNLMKTRIETQRREQEELDLRVTKLRREIATPIRRAAMDGQKSESTEAVPAYGAQLRVVDQSLASA